MGTYNKAIAALVGAVAACLLVFNIDLDAEVQATIISIGAGLVTLFAPANQE